MKNNSQKEIIIINKDSLKNYKCLSLGLENCENFNIDIADVIDISCEAYRYVNGSRYGDCYHTSNGYIKISSMAKETLSDFAYSKDGKYISKNCNEDDYKLYVRMAQCNDMCEFSLLGENNKWKHIFVPYDALEGAVYHSEIDHANCPSFEICENGDMVIRFGKLSKNPIIQRNNYSELVKGWSDVLGDFNPKKLMLKVNSCNVEYDKDADSFVVLNCTILNKKRKNKRVIFILNEFDKLCNHINGKVKHTRVIMSKMCSGNIYFGIEGFFGASCQSCEVSAD